MTLTSHIRKAWNVFKPNWKFIVPAALATILIYGAFQVLSGISRGHAGASFVVAIISIVLSLALSLGWSQVVLKLVRSGSAKWPDFKTSPKTWVHYFLARIIYGVFSLIAVLVILIPVFVAIMHAGSGAAAIVICAVVGILGLALLIWLALRFMFISFIAADQPTLRGWGIIKASWRLTKHRGWKILLFSLLIILLNIVINIAGVILLILGLLGVIPLVVGGIVCLVGFIITGPVSGLAFASLYDYLRSLPDTLSPIPEPESVQ
jgi:hypothetical protein